MSDRKIQMIVNAVNAGTLAVEMARDALPDFLSLEKRDGRYVAV